MRGLSWTVGIWAVALIVLAPAGWRSVLRARSFGITRAQWGLLFVLIGSHSHAAPTTAEEVLADPVVAERLIRGAFDALALLLIVPVLINAIRRSRPLKTPGLTTLTAYGVIAGVSALYTIAFTVTVGKVFELAAVLAALWLIALGPDPADEFRSTARLFVLLEAALVGVAVIGFFLLPGSFLSTDGRPGFITSRTMGSPYAHFDGLSASSALIFAYALASALNATNRRARLGWAALALMGTLGMLLTSGRQGLIIWLVSAAVLLWFYRRKLLLLLITPATALVVWANWESLWSIVTRYQAAVNISTWSGRLTWWGVGLDAASTHPLTGFGYGAGGRWAALQQIGQDSASSIHNGYLEALLGVGLIGLICLMIPVVRVALWSFFKLAARSEPTLAILIVPLLLHTFVSLGFGGWVNSDLVLIGCLVGISDVDPWRRPMRGSPRRLSRVQQAEEFLS